MKQKTVLLRASTIAFMMIVAVSCNSNSSEGEVTDTAQIVPGLADTLPPVVNPGVGDTTGATIQTPPTNDQNSIMPDSTSIAQ